MVHNRGGAVHDLFASADESFSELRIIAGYRMLTAGDPEIKAEESIFSKHLLAKCGVRS